MVTPDKLSAMIYDLCLYCISLSKMPDHLEATRDYRTIGRRISWIIDQVFEGEKEDGEAEAGAEE